MRYLVTGGAGFIGSHLTDLLLKDGNEVVILDDLSTGRRINVDKRASLVVGSVLDTELLRFHLNGMDGVFHLAAVASVQACNERWFETHLLNQAATVKILDVLSEFQKIGQNIPFVMASSAAVYGDAEGRVTEDMRPNPLSAYAVDKLGSELHAQIGNAIKNLQTTCLRFFNVYGPRQDPSSPYSGVISIFAERILKDLPLSIHGDGEQTRDFIYVADVAKGLHAAMRTSCSTPRVVNLCTGVSVNLLDLIDSLAASAKKSPKLRYAPSRNGDVRNSLGSNSYCEKTLGFVPRTSIDEGLKNLIESLV